MTKISQLAYRNNYLIPELINQYYWPQHSNLIHYKAFCPNNILYLWWEHTYPRNFESLHLCFYCSKTIQFFFITRGRLVTFFSCSEINIAGNNELYIRKEDVVNGSTELRKMWRHERTLRISKQKKMRI